MLNSLRRQTTLLRSLELKAWVDCSRNCFGAIVKLHIVSCYLGCYILQTFSRYINLSYDVAVFKWITSCHKNRMTTRVITLLRECVTSLTTSVTTILIFIENMSTLKAIKSFFKSHMIKRILHSWSFHMKIIKLAKGSFNTFHMKWSLV